MGRGDNVSLGARDGVRTPMQWSRDRNAGFSTAEEGKLYLPVIADPVYGYQAVNVAAQARQPASLLNTMKRLIAARRTSPVFGRGTIEFLRPRNQKRSEEHTSELQSRLHLVCRLLLEKKKKKKSTA